jgi:glycerol-3-phosphate acyltransferase PlsY
MTQPPAELKLALATILGYALGCLCTGYYWVRWRTGRDIRTLGSGSVGARNVGRLLGKSGFLVTLLGDFAKGSFAVWLARELGTVPWGTGLAVPAVVLGHIYPAPLGFRGGRGVATFLGASLLLDYRLVLALGALLAIALILTRSFTVAGLIAVAILPSALPVLKSGRPQAIGIVAAVLLVLLAHRDKILTMVKERAGGRRKNTA